MFEKYSQKPLILSKVFILVLALLWIICLMMEIRLAGAADNPVTKKISEALYPGLYHFFDLVDPEKKVLFDPKKTEQVLDFVESPKDESALYRADDIFGIPSAYYEFDVRKDLSDIAAYSFNPDIPCIATMPSSTRLFEWLGKNRQKSVSPRVRQYLDNLDTPVVIRGLRFVENTPDINSGAYYAYDMYQALVIFKHRQRNVLISISRQTDVSSVGKKGYVLGADEDWDYFYSGEKGLTIPALGWVRSYMYGSRTVAVYDEIGGGAPKVRCAVFKWLRAGWSGINMVKNRHIYYGLKRFATPFKEIIESPLLPPVNEMASTFKRIRNFSEKTLRSKMSIYSNILKNRYNSENQRPKKIPTKLFDNGNHWKKMTKDEMESVLVVEHMKYVMGKTQGSDVRALLDLPKH